MWNQKNTLGRRITLKFRKINDTTINCIITQDDLKKHGIDLDDLFDRRKNAVEFIRRIILKAASSVNLNIKNDYTSMRISVLPDQSVSLTISQDPVESAKIREHKEMAAQPGERRRDDAEAVRQASARRMSSAASERGTYVYQFSSVMDTVKCCRILASCRGIETSLYFVRETGAYYLIIAKGTDPAEDYSSIVLSLNEFGKMVSCDDVTLAYLKEHSDCILRSGAAQQISEIYS
jgi:negative regulator of genetic competence, sporulation and motility